MQQSKSSEAMKNPFHGVRKLFWCILPTISQFCFEKGNCKADFCEIGDLIILIHLNRAVEFNDQTHYSLTRLLNWLEGVNCIY